MFRLYILHIDIYANLKRFFYFHCNFFLTIGMQASILEASGTKWYKVVY